MGSSLTLHPAHPHAGGLPEAATPAPLLRKSLSQAFMLPLSPFVSAAAGQTLAPTPAPPEGKVKHRGAGIGGGLAALGGRLRSASSRHLPSATDGEASVRRERSRRRSRSASRSGRRSRSGRFSDTDSGGESGAWGWWGGEAWRGGATDCIHSARCPRCPRCARCACRCGGQRHRLFQHPVRLERAVVCGAAGRRADGRVPLHLPAPAPAEPRQRQLRGEAGAGRLVWA